MYFIKYGEKYIHDPRTNTILSEAVLDTEINKSDILTFSITSTHKLYNIIKERDRDNLVSVLWDDEILFRGEITTIESNFYLTKSVTCRGELSYLNDSIVRPYSTLEGEVSRTAPSSVDGYFEFLINEHNSQVEVSKRFKIGKNEGALLDSNNYIYRSDITYPFVGETIKDKIINSIGGYLKLEYNKDGTRTISLLKEVDEVNSQLIDFGVNLLDFVKNDETASTISFIIPLGATINDENEDTIDEYLTIADEPDGELEYGYVKYGDMIYSVETVAKFGFIGKAERFDDITVASNLVKAGLAALKEYDNPITTIEIKAIDLSIIKPDYKQIQVGQYIHARSKPHNFDSYMLCSKISYDLIQPDNNVFTLGHVYDTFTGRSNTAIDTLNKSLADSTGENYKLPTATNEILGGVKVGEGLTIDENGRLNGTKPYSLPTASNLVLGGVKVGKGLSIDENGVLSTVGGGTSIIDASITFSARAMSVDTTTDEPLPSHPDSWTEKKFFLCCDTSGSHEDKTVTYSEVMGTNPKGGEVRISYTNTEIIPHPCNIGFTRHRQMYEGRYFRKAYWHQWFYDITYNSAGEVVDYKVGSESFDFPANPVNAELEGSENEALLWMLEDHIDSVPTRQYITAYVKDNIVVIYDNKLFYPGQRVIASYGDYSIDITIKYKKIHNSSTIGGET